MLRSSQLLLNAFREPFLPVLWTPRHFACCRRMNSINTGTGRWRSSFAMSRNAAFNPFWTAATVDLVIVIEMLRRSLDRSFVCRDRPLERLQGVAGLLRCCERWIVYRDDVSRFCL